MLFARLHSQCLSLNICLCVQQHTVALCSPRYLCTARWLLFFIVSSTFINTHTLREKLLSFGLAAKACQRNCMCSLRLDSLRLSIEGGVELYIAIDSTMAGIYQCFEFYTVLLFVFCVVVDMLFRCTRCTCFTSHSSAAVFVILVTSLLFLIDRSFSCCNLSQVWSTQSHCSFSFVYLLIGQRIELPLDFEGTHEVHHDRTFGLETSLWLLNFAFESVFVFFVFFQLHVWLLHVAKSIGSPVGCGRFYRSRIGSDVELWPLI